VLKISFSTLGCPNWLWKEILVAANDLNYQGIELRGLGPDLFIPQAKMFLPENLSQTRESLEKRNLEISCISTECVLSSDSDDVILKAKSYIDLAESLGVKYIRILGDVNPWPCDSVNQDVVFNNLVVLEPYAKSKNVIMLVESNGIYAKSKLLSDLLSHANSPFIQALWDLNHPVRYYNESPEETWQNIGKYVRHVHVKDSVIKDGSLTYCMLGYGDLPITEAFKLLKNNGYNEYVSLEWTKRWNNELEDAGIIFSHFAHNVRNIWDKA